MDDLKAFLNYIKCTTVKKGNLLNLPILLHSSVIKNAYNSDVSFEVKLQAYFQTFHLLDISCEPTHIYKHQSGCFLN